MPPVEWHPFFVTVSGYCVVSKQGAWEILQGLRSPPLTPHHNQGWKMTPETI